MQMQSTTYTEKELMSLTDVCDSLSITMATGRNWIKLGKLIPETTIRRTPFFTQKYVDTMKSDIQQGRNSALKSRRNKKYVSGSNMYHSYVSNKSKNITVVANIIDMIERERIPISDEIVIGLLAECAIQMIFQHENDYYYPRTLREYLSGDYDKVNYTFLIQDLIGEVYCSKEMIDNHSKLFDQTFFYEENEDILGLLYISLRNIGNRKATGSYYTPTDVVKRLCAQLFSAIDMHEKIYFDPCCGTGNFLLQLPAEICYKNVFGNDIDPISVKLARINYALKYDITEQSIINKHITESDYLSFGNDTKFDVILGNPPWGYHFTQKEKERLKDKFTAAVGSNVESYDVFVEQALRNLNLDGILSFVLPEAILNVKSHTAIRSIMLRDNSIQYLEFLGNVFHKVQCPCIILQMVHNGKPFDSKGMVVNEGRRKYLIQRTRQISPDCFQFALTDEEYSILEKIASCPSAITLKDNAVFALGIVTGNNKEYLCDSLSMNGERILKGSDIYKYKYVPSDNYIVYKPDLFQQCAPTKWYRAKEKLFYRFISNQLVFAYDDKQTLSLNSCNIVIPQLDFLSIKYVMAVLNSRIAQYFFKKSFHSVKVLRSHIEAIPIPVVSENQQCECVELVDQMIHTEERGEIEKLYNQLDGIVASFFGLTEHEHRVIIELMLGENLFLF